MTKASRGQIMDAAGGFRCQPFPAFSLAADMGLQGDDERTRRAIGRYLYWRTERQKWLMEWARLRRYIVLPGIKEKRTRALEHARAHHRRVLYHLGQARAAHRAWESRHQEREERTVPCD